MKLGVLMFFSSLDGRLASIEAKLATIIAKQAQIAEAIKQEQRIMGIEFDNLTATVHRNTSVTQSAVDTFTALVQQLRDNADDPVAIKALADELEGNSATLSAAIANTNPAAPAPAPTA